MKNQPFLIASQWMRQCILLLALTVIIGLSACNDDVDPISNLNPARTGLFIVNEGNFGAGNGAIKFVGNGTTPADTISKAFQTANGRALGDVVQSMAIVGDQTAYIVVNNDHKVEVMNLADFKSTATITGLHLPRYALVVSSSKAYISNWGTFDGETPSYLAVVDLNTHTVTDTITLGSYYGSDRLYLHNNKVYVMNNFVNTISVVDVATNRVEQTIEVGDAPSTAVIDGTNLLVLCSGSYGLDFNTSADDTPAQIARVSLANQTVSNTVNIGSLGDHPSRIALAANNSIVLAHAQALWSLPISTLQLPNTPLVSNVSAYGLGISSEGLIYVGDAGSFTSAGTVHIYTATGQLKESYTSGGVGPGNFVWAE